MRGFEATIAKQNERLGQMLGVKKYTPSYLCQSYYNDDNELVDCTCGHCEDGIMVIPVNVTLKSGTKMTIEDGYITECNHKGAELSTVDQDVMRFDTHENNYIQESHTVRAYVCDGCSEVIDCE